MTDKALVTRRGGLLPEASSAIESSEAQGLGLTVEENLGHATLVSGTAKQYAELEAQGFRVKLLTETNILEVGSYRINIESGAPRVPTKLQVPKALEKTWRHHLVQLAGPPTEEWSRTIEGQGVDVVEPISAYALFVVGSPEQVANLKNLPFVTWVGPFKPAYRIAPGLREMKGMIRYVSIGVYPQDEVEAVKEAISKVKATIVRESAPMTDHQGTYHRLVVEVDAKHLATLACLPGVRWLEFASSQPGLDGERETQIVAENLNAQPAPNTAPVTGYQAWLATVGLSGAGVAVAICDTGVDAMANNNVSGHLDLRGRQIGVVDYTGGAVTTDTDGHGTHVAGIAVGNAATGQTEGAAPNNFLWGQGIAPQANYVAQNAILGPWPPANFGTLTTDAANAGAHVQNNSWFDGGGPGAGYTANSRRFDQLVRDPNDGTATLDYLVIVFSAGNAGPNPSTITPPKEAKNPITVGNSLNFRPGLGDATDNIRGMRTTSSRGPALDGRILPNIVAPGTDVSSTWSETGDTSPPPNGYGPPIAGTGTPDPNNPNNILNQYMFMSGTSMASPHVAGCCALLIEWWRNRTDGKNPSPALLKALLINGAEDLVGGPKGGGGNLTNIPNNDQGWGRVSLENILQQAPASDRGPKIFSDQRHAFNANAQEHLIRVAPADPARPMRITLVWTDAPGAANANPALVNDLDLEVVEVATNTVFKGNVFSNGFSITGGAFDNRNNIECVYIQNPSGTYEVRVIASALSGNARPPFNNTAWQDFALVIDNAEVPSGAPVSVVPVIDRSGSMVGFGYVDNTRTSSKEFVDLMGIDDKVGVVSFGDSGTVEFPAGGPPALQTITGQPVREAAKTEIDDVGFGGCTFMGDGIIKARDLLAPAVGSRAMVLLSDGYDNKGCQQNNAARPSAMDAVATLPANLPVYTCAMGPASDQALLEQIATATSGRYYFMPTIDDLFEIYNYIRGQVTGTGIIVNESAMASSSRVAAFVDALATEVTFSVAWADTKLRFVPGDPKKANEVSVRLRTPRGRLLHPDASDVRRIEGKGYVIFKLQEPLAGQWFVEVSTAGNTHVRYTVGGFVRSRLRLLATIPRRQLVTGMALDITTQIFDGREPIQGFKADLRVAAPSLSIAGLLDKHKNTLKNIRAATAVGGDKLPTDIAKLIALQTKLLRDNKPDIFARLDDTVSLREVTIGNLINLGLRHLAPPTGIPGGTVGGGGTIPIIPPGAPFTPLTPLVPPLTALSGVLIGQFKKTQQQGSYNTVVTASGTSPISNTRFVRKDMLSVLVK